MTSVLEQYEEEIIQKSIQQGIKKGFQQGFQQRTLEIAESFLTDGFEVDFVVKYTGLPVDSVKKLKSHLEVH